ncbi:MAG: epimerase [Deltaproteobacteria bacterium RIFOXYD12_FULL_53_23]|nr:MAG: epimerase [Deltaproteobacteria bacterium RIFOXYD12_FULL_53_23]
MSATLKERIEQLQGPILVTGASGFIGCNLFRTLLKYRRDVYGTSSKIYAWRLEDLPRENIIVVDLLVEYNLKELLDTVKPQTVFDNVTYGGYSFQQDPDLIYRTNINYTVRLITELEKRGIRRFIHAGSSSEYGDNVGGSVEDIPLYANSHYSVTKAAIANLIYFYGKKKKFPGANLRLYSIYGPYEDSARLLPTIIAKGLQGELPPFVSPETSRDFVYVDDCVEAFINAALYLAPENFGESFNVGSGDKTTILDVVATAQEVFAIKAEPEYTMPSHSWDVDDWYANTEKTRSLFYWRATIPFRVGLERMAEWFRSLADREVYLQSSKKFGIDEKYSVSAIIACYKDGQAIPFMYERLKKVFEELNIDHEIIFINDCSPDDSEEVIRSITARDRRVIGVSHSRNFGSQSAFKSGMEIATKNSVVLLDGDLQDPPEIIKDFVGKWKEGYEVVYGRRNKRSAPLYMQFLYKAFYRVFNKASFLNIPEDAGDFSLIDRKVVRALLKFPEKDLFMRGIRAYAGFRQIGVPYHRPERMFGTSTNNFLKNIDWAKKGILSFSHLPLNVVSGAGFFLFVFSLVCGLWQLASRILFPDLAPKGLTTVILAIVFFGAINLFGLSIIGEYIAKIFEEVKGRPHFIRRHLIRDGEVRPASDESYVPQEFI